MSDENFDPATGEVLADPPGTSRAADGNLIPSAAYSGGDIINLLEGGQFQADFHTQVADLLAQMNDAAEATGGKARGKVTLTLDFIKEDNAFRIGSKIAVKAPELPRQKSIMWTDNNHNLTAFPPNQMQMFGLIKSVGGSGGLRRA